MLLSPVENTAVLEQQWIQRRPRISQHFGLNPQIYSQFGMKGHNGIDFGIPVGTKIFAAEHGECRTKDSGKAGYGLHVKVRNPYKGAECVYAHLSEVVVPDGHTVNPGDLIGYSGNTGFSTGPHLHFGRRLLKHGAEDALWAWAVLDYNNGFYGWYDCIDQLITWKGTFLKNNL